MPTQHSPRMLERDEFEETMFNADPEAANDGLLQTHWKSAQPLNQTSTTMFTIRSWLRPQAMQRSKNLHKTAYLDGLRGFAALLVYWQHYVLWAHNADRLAQSPVFENSYGYESKYYFAALPGVRLLFCGGHFAVATFFVLSGYVLSIKPLRLIESDDITGLVHHLASAVFRRWLRLFLPVAATVFVYATSWHALGLWVDGTKPHGSWSAEMWFLYCEFKNFSFVFKDGGVPWLSYNVHAWSIPFEFKGSMVVFASLVAFSRCSLHARLWCQVGLMSYFLYIADGWYCAMFVAGMLLSHLDLLAAMDKLPRFIVRLAPYKTVIYYHFLVISIYLGGVPSENLELDQLARNGGWYFLSLLKPQAVFDYKWFYLFWASTLLVSAVSHIGWLKRFFETRVCQYLGRISFALYLVHGPLLWILGDRVYAAVGLRGQRQMEHIPQWVDRFVLPQTGPTGLEFAFLLPHMMLLPITLCAAEFVTRAVDKPSVQFAAWVYGKTLPSVPRRHSKA